MPDLLFHRKEENRKKFKSLQIDSVKNRFAFWLNELDVKFLSDANMARLNEGGSSANDRQTAAGFENKLLELRDSVLGHYHAFRDELFVDFTENINAETGEYRGFVEGPTDLIKLADIFENWGKYAMKKKGHESIEKKEPAGDGDNSGNDNLVEAGEGLPAAKFHGQVLDKVIKRYPAFAEAAIYKKSVDKLKGLASEKYLSNFIDDFFSADIYSGNGFDFQSKDGGAIQRNRRFMKEHLNECRRRLEDRMKRLNNSAEKVRGVAISRLQRALGGFLGMDDSDSGYSPERESELTAGSLRSRANLSNQKRRFRVMAEKALATFQEKLPESPLLGAFAGKVQGVQFLVSHIQELVGNVGLMENDLAVGRFTLQNGKAVRLAKKLTEVQN